MLIRHLARTLTAILLAAVAITGLSSPAHADYLTCLPDGSTCWIVVTTPGGGGSGGGGTSGSFQCTAKTAVWGCFDPMYGWYNPSDGCYWRKLTGAEVPPATDPVWHGHHPDGAIYDIWCSGYISGTGLIWRATNPPGYNNSYDYYTAAERAIEELRLGAPIIRMAPNPGTTGLVGLPVWMWTPTGPTTWARPTPTKSASAGGITASANATATQIVWDMGDGNKVTCPNPGTPYTAARGGSMSPTCGYKYAQPSRRVSGGKYKIVATTTWKVHWWVSGGGSGVSGDLTLTQSSTTWIQVDELQVVTR
jgi:hypothetical protein